MTNAEFASKLLQEAASFFRHVGEQNPPLKEQMEASAQTYDLVADLVSKDPGGEVPGMTPEDEPQA